MTPLDEHSAPVSTVREFLRSIWRDNSPEDAKALWRRAIEESPSWVAAALASLDAVLAAPRRT